MTSVTRTAPVAECTLAARACAKVLFQAPKNPVLSVTFCTLMIGVWLFSVFQISGWKGALVAVVALPVFLCAVVWVAARRAGRAALVDTLTMEDSSAFRIALGNARVTAVEEQGSSTTVEVAYDSARAVGLDADAKEIRDFRAPMNLLPNPVRLTNLRLGAGGTVDARSALMGNLVGEVEIYGIEDESAEPDDDRWDVTWEQVLFRYPSWELSVGS